jgi:hypothetical protein
MVLVITEEMRDGISSISSVEYRPRKVQKPIDIYGMTVIYLHLFI